MLAWTVLPPLLGASFPLDVVESLSWGREWQWGYYKHPPLAPWTLHVFYRAFGAAGPFLLSQLCIAATLWCVWRTGLRLMAPQQALVGTLLTMGVAYYTFPALEFNHNIAQMPLWAALGHAMLAALQDGRLRQWALLGLWAGLGLLTKYSVAILLAVLALYLLLSPQRRVLRRPGPWLALAVMLAVFAPHVYWLWQSDWLPMAYAGSRAVADSGNPRLAALAFLAAQALNHVPLAVIALVALWRARGLLPQAPHARPPAYLLAVALGPGLLVTVLGVVTGLRLRDMWGVPMWAFSGLLVAAWLPPSWLPVLRPRLLRALVVWLVLVSLLAGLHLAYGAHWRKRPARTDWPAAALAAQAHAAWDGLSRCPLDTVAGEYWVAGLVAVAQPKGPSVLIDGDARYSPWITVERLRAHGALWVWLDRDGERTPPPPLDRIEEGPAMRWYQGQWQIPWRHDPQGAPLVVNWRAYVPAACAR